MLYIFVMTVLVANSQTTFACHRWGLPINNDNIFANITPQNGQLYMVGGWSVCYIENYTVAISRTECEVGTGWGLTTTHYFNWTEFCGIGGFGLYYHGSNQIYQAWTYQCC